MERLERIMDSFTDIFIGLPKKLPLLIREINEETWNRGANILRFTKAYSCCIEDYMYQKEKYIVKQYKLFGITSDRYYYRIVEKNGEIVSKEKHRFPKNYEQPSEALLEFIKPKLNYK